MFKLVFTNTTSHSCHFMTKWWQISVKRRNEPWLQSSRNYGRKLRPTRKEKKMRFAGLIYKHAKPQPNNCTILMWHMATLLDASDSGHLTTLSWHVASCWVFTMYTLEPTTPNMLCATGHSRVAKMCNMLHWNVVYFLLQYTRKWTFLLEYNVHVFGITANSFCPTKFKLI